MCVCLFVSKIGIGCENADFHMNNIQNKYVFLSLIPQHYSLTLFISA